METLSAVFSSVQTVARRYHIVATLTALLVAHRLWRLQQRRTRTLPRAQERVLVIGASSGVGRSIAHEYAASGARVCVVGRRAQVLNEVAEECANLLPKSAAASGNNAQERVFAVAGDFTKADDMLAVREKLEQRWGGLDTLIVCAGVSALRPLLEVAGLKRLGGLFVPAQVDADGLQRTISVASVAMQNNYLGPLVCAVTFIPYLSAKSIAPSILQLSSLAAIIPAPTRSLYTSTKASALLLYQSLAIEHPEIAFSWVMPATIEGDFRASAVDGGHVREEDPNKYGLKRIAVAKRCIEAIDNGEKAVYMPNLYSRFGHLVYWLVPSIVERAASRKYNFSTKGP